MTDPGNTDQPFQLSSGGLVHLLQQRIRGAGAGDFPIRTQLVIALVVLWLPLVALTLIENTFTAGSVAQPFIEDLVPQVRFLIALPLLLLADMAIDPAVGVAIGNLESSGIVPADERTRFRAALTKLENDRDSIWPDLVMLALAFGSTWLFQPGYGESAILTRDTSWLMPNATENLSIAGWWYALVSAPLFQFILFRWIWRFMIWAGFLYRVSRIRLALQPTHPDLAGGLGILGLSQQTFAIVFVAFTTVMSSTIAHNILFESDTLPNSRAEIIVFVLVCVAVIYAPLLCFSKKLYAARRQGLNQYGVLGQRLSGAFAAKWLAGTGSNVGTELKDSTDPSTMADYGATFDAVRSMRVIPATTRGLLMTTAALTIPFLPLALTEFSITELLQRIADALV